MELRRAAAVLFICSAAALYAQEITATKWVEDWENGKAKTELRKINGRWWTEDNREVTPPGTGQVFWTPDSRLGAKPRPVASVAEDLGGRDIYKLMSERATERSRNAYANKSAAQRGPSLTRIRQFP